MNEFHTNDAEAFQNNVAVEFGPDGWLLQFPDGSRALLHVDEGGFENVDVTPPEVEPTAEELDDYTNNNPDLDDAR